MVDANDDKPASHWTRLVFETTSTAMALAAQSVSHARARDSVSAMAEFESAREAITRAVKAADKLAGSDEEKEIAELIEQAEFVVGIARKRAEESAKQSAEDLAALETEKLLEDEAGDKAVKEAVEAAARTYYGMKFLDPPASIEHQQLFLREWDEGRVRPKDAVRYRESVRPLVAAALEAYKAVREGRQAVLRSPRPPLRLVTDRDTDTEAQ